VGGVRWGGEKELSKQSKKKKRGGILVYGGTISGGERGGGEVMGGESWKEKTLKGFWLCKGRGKRKRRSQSASHEVLGRTLHRR